MNALNLTNVEFSEYKNDYIPVYSFKTILQYCLRPIGIITCVINILIFSHKELLAKSPAFVYLLAMSYIDLFYLAPLLYLNVINPTCQASSTQCGAQTQYWTFITFMILNELLSSALALSNILIELFLTVQRLFVIVNKPYMRNWAPKYVISAILIGTHTFYVPLLLRFTVVSQDVYLANSVNITEYRYVKSDFGSSQIGVLLPTIWSIIRLALCGPILLFFNLLSVYYFRIFLNKKKATTGTTSVSNPKSSSENNLTLMLIMTSFLYTFGNLPFMIYYSISNIAPNMSNDFTHFITWFSLVCLITLIIMKPVIYFTFNKIYKDFFLHYVFCKSVRIGSIEGGS
jgi:hypothetical protein